LLLEEGANINAIIDGGWTPLHLASFDNPQELAKLLIAKGGNVNATANNRQISLHLAYQEVARPALLIVQTKNWTISPNCSPDQ
jgi:ankyrin repeat protein